MSPVRPASDESIQKAAEMLRAGQVVAFPTETVYGLGANAYDDCAVQQIFRIKGRPAHNPLIVHIAALSELALVTTPEVQRDLAAVLSKLSPYIPGPLSIVLPRNERICSTVSAGLATVAVRIPDHATAQALLKACDFPIAAPSANPSNYISPTQAGHVAAQLGDQISLILDGGPCEVGIESTILDLSVEPPRVLRQGRVTAEELATALAVPVGQLLRDQKEVAAVRAPGMLREHYAPRTPITLLAQLRTKLPERCGLIYLNAQHRPTIQHPFQAEKSLSSDGDLAEVSRNLFSTMREFDTLKLDLIVIEGCEPVGIGRAIMDRLTRASARWNGERNND